MSEVIGSIQQSEIAQVWGGFRSVLVTELGAAMELSPLGFQGLASALRTEAG